MPDKMLPTKFAPAERASDADILRQRALFEKTPLLNDLLNAVPDILMVLNRERQIVFMNQGLYKVLNFKDSDPSLIWGLRPGEALRCMHAFESVGGCGTTDFCSTCGAMKAILSSQNHQEDIQECRIIRDVGVEALDFRIWTRPLTLEGELFTIFALTDISHEKRREALERIFFHDILNTAGGLKGSIDLIRDATVEERNEFQEVISRLANDLIEEIQTQRQLTAAENRELAVHPDPLNTGDMVLEVVELYASHEVARNRKLIVDDRACDVSLVTDRTLLRRILGNMVKNALEASPVGEAVSLGCESELNGAVFWVRNVGFIPPEVQLQIFQRSFSTKGSGRGLGTYSIKLLTEQYLKGQVSFDSSQEQGTIFRVFCPNLVLEQKLMAIPPLSSNHKTHSLRILLAEDNPVNQKLAVRLLEREGHRVVAVDTGKDALGVLLHESFDLILMDCLMPEMDGFEATRAIRGSAMVCNPQIPIVALTGDTGDEGRKKCLAAGMNDHLSKPIDKQMLLAALEKWAQ